MNPAASATIAQAKLQQQTLWQFLCALPQTMEAQIFYALILSGVLGIMAHYVHKWMKDEIQGSLWSYLFVQYPKRTAMSFGAYLAWIMSLIGTGVFVTASGEFVGYGIVLILGFTNGYGVDSLANKGGRAEWTTQQRQDFLKGVDSP